jgi:cytochrome P450
MEGKTIFYELTRSRVPPEVLTIQRLRDESQLILSAGVDTTSRILAAIVCQFCTYPDILSKLRAELQLVWDHHGAQPT